MAIIRDIMDLMEGFAPISLAESWDNCGLLVGDESKEVKKILVALEPSMATIDYAIEKNVDLLLTHHPLMLSKINRITAHDLEGQKLIKLINNHIDLYAAHTNLDKAPLGLNHFFATALGLNHIKVLSPISSDPFETSGLGRVGELEKAMTLEDFGKKVQDILNINYIQFVGDKKQLVKKIALVTGSGLSELDKAISNGADVFITGDIKYHNALYAKEIGIALIDATHFGSENIVVKLLGDILKNQVEHVEVIFDKYSSNPIENL